MLLSEKHVSDLIISFLVTIMVAIMVTNPSNLGVKKTARIAGRSGSRRWALFFFIALNFNENIQFPHQVL